MNKEPEEGKPGDQNVFSQVISKDFSWGWWEDFRLSFQYTRTFKWELLKSKIKKNDGGVPLEHLSSKGHPIIISQFIDNDNIIDWHFFTLSVIF